MNPIYKFELSNGNSENILTEDNLLRGWYISTDGTLIADPEYILSYYLPVTPGQTYYLKTQDGSQPSRGSILTIYDENKTRIGFFINYLVSGLMPSNARFVRLSLCDDSFSGYSLSTVNSYVGGERRVYPLYAANLAKEYEIERGQQFYREKLNGTLQFVDDDFDFIKNSPFETQFELNIYISKDAGVHWSNYWRGEFYKTDGKINEDDKTFDVSPSPLDDYTTILAGMEREYNLIDLLPEINNVKISKRPLVQVYVPGESVISCFLSGMYWEQDCEAVEDETALINDYYFALSAGRRLIDVSGGPSGMPSFFDGNTPSNIQESFSFTKGNYTFSYSYAVGSQGTQALWMITNNVGGQQWSKTLVNQQPSPIPYEIQLTPVSGTGASGTITAYLHDIKVYARYLLDVESIAGVETHELPVDDIVADNRNYKRAIGYGLSNIIAFSTNTSNTPTEWGLKEPGVYYKEPYIAIGVKYFPVGRSHWGDVSIWFTFSAVDWVFETLGRKDYVLKDAFPLASVINVLLNKIEPGIDHIGTADYSQLLYGTTPITDQVFELFVTQKSNILAGDYQTPAQKAPITLKMVTDMLRDCFCAYWYVENGKFKIEHIKWFKNGGRYTGTPAISHDLTVERVTRNGKNWAFETSKYEYAKQNMPERYQFGWMDDVTDVFEGVPIEVKSKFVERGNIEEITVSNFNPDVDYMLLNPGACSRDGFALLGAITNPDTGEKELPFVSRTINGVTVVNQNGYLTFYNLLPIYYIYDLPAYNVNINGNDVTASGIKRNKHQSVRFPVVDDPNPMQLIKTNIGNGQIQKLLINLSSRNVDATLVYDTYNYNE